jgi:hypothetical protein
MVKKENKKITELAKGKPRKEEEKFFIKFSGIQLNAVLLLILSATFLVQGAVNYLQFINRLEAIRPWLFSAILSLFFLVLSVIAITAGSVIFPLKTKRRVNLISFGTFITGVILFLVSLIYLLFLI